MQRTAARARAFSLIELVIVVVIIAIIGAIAIPKMSRGSSGAADSSLVQDLATMRTAIDLYNTEHPTATLTVAMGGPAVATALTSYSDSLGNTSPTKTATAIYGPYLKAVPTLPVGTNKGLTTVTATGPAGTGAFGWYFDGVSFYANDPGTDVDASGNAYNGY
jgi:prepilin-type N-terminal cleavage/methylation domain-containing protein